MIRVWLIAMTASTAWASQPPAPPVPVPTRAPTELSKSAEVIAEDERFGKRLEAVDAAMAKVKDLRADFEQRRHTPLLKRPLVSRGEVLTKGDFVRWETASPRASSLLIGDGTIRMYYPADKLVEVYPVDEGFRDLAGAPLPRLSGLKARFIITRLSPSDLGASDTDANLLAVHLTPKSEEMRKHVASVKVLIDEARPAATKVVMTDPDGEVTEIIFTTVKLNTGIEDEDVDPKLPDDVRISRPIGGEERTPGKGVPKKAPASEGPVVPTGAPR